MTIRLQPSSALVRFICLAVCSALFAPCLPIAQRLVRAAPSPPSYQEGGAPDKELPDLDVERTLEPGRSEAAPEIPSELAGWSPYDEDLNASMTPIIVTITAPANGATFSIGAPVTISATVSASTVITIVSFRANGVLIGIDKVAPYSLTYSLLSPGNKVLTAVAQASNGTTGTSAPVNITIAGASASITSPANGAQFSAPANIPITGRCDG